MKRWGGVALALALASSCATFHYVARPQAGGCGEGADKVLSKTRWAVTVFKPDELNASSVPESCQTDPCQFECFPCHGNGFAEVKVETNWAYSLVTVLTLGFVAPVKISYACSAPD